MAGFGTYDVNGTDSAVFEEILIDPETDKEIVFRADSEEELEQAIEDFFNPDSSDEEESSYVG